MTTPKKNIQKTDKNQQYVNLSDVVGELKNDFLYGVFNEENIKKFPTLKVLSEKYNVSYATLRERSAKEKWSSQKEDVKKKIDKKVKEKKSNYEAEKIVKIDSEYESAFSKLRKKTVKAIDNHKKPRSSDLLNYSNTLIICYEGEKVAHGESLEGNNSNGWDALEEAFKEPPSQED